MNSAADRAPRRAAAAWLCVVAVGCTTTVTPPPAPPDPTTVFLLREAMHTGVVLPPSPADGAAGFVEFGYGDWSWYALGNDAWWCAFPTVLWPTQGALGRRAFRAETAEELVRSVRWAELSPLTVGASAAAALRARLEAEFAAGSAQLVRRPELGIDFVPDARSYWLPHNCADAAAAWFVELGCEVGWSPFRTNLAVGPPDRVAKP